MTKLLQWLIGAGLFLSVWAALVTEKIKLASSYSDCWANFILFLPIYAVLAFGVVSVGIISWRVYKFNDCKEAAEELQQQIKDAREDLKRKGMKFD